MQIPMFTLVWDQLSAVIPTNIQADTSPGTWTFKLDLTPHVRQESQDQGGNTTCLPPPTLPYPAPFAHSYLQPPCTPKNWLSWWSQSKRLDISIHGRDSLCKYIYIYSGCGWEKLCEHIHYITFGRKVDWCWGKERRAGNPADVVLQMKQRP